MKQELIYTADLVVPITGAPLSDGAVRIADGRIRAVGKRQELLAEAPGAEVIAFGSAILMPPLVNAHTHLELTDFPAWQESQESGDSNTSFVDWILELIRIKQGVDPEALAGSVRNGLDQLLRTGTGAVCDILSIHALDSAYLDTPLHGWLCFELIGLDEGMGQVLPMMANDWLAAQPLGPLQRGLSPHAPYTVGSMTLAKLSHIGNIKDVLVSVHAAESVQENQYLQESAGDIVDKLYPMVGWHKPMPPYGVDTAGYLDKAGLLQPATLLVHGVQFEADAIRMIASAGASVVLCPRSNARLGVGVAPIESYLCQNVNLALGTDSLASNDSLSLWDEMAYAREAYGPALDPIRLLAMATINGARALQIDDRIGSLQEGVGVNFQVLRPSELPPVEQLADFLCRSERTDDVEHLYLDGIDVLAGGK